MLQVTDLFKIFLNKKKVLLSTSTFHFSFSSFLDEYYLLIWRKSEVTQHFKWCTNLLRSSLVTYVLIDSKMLVLGWEQFNNISTVYCQKVHLVHLYITDISLSWIYSHLTILGLTKVQFCYFVSASSNIFSLRWKKLTFKFWKFSGYYITYQWEGIGWEFN